MRFLHTMLRVRNLDAALKFYGDAMGLKEVRRIDNDKGRFTLVFLCAPEDVDALKKLPQTRGAPLVELT
jgi:lactoylglutathione lyase